MRLIIAIFTLSLVVCLTLSSTENGLEVDEDELLDGIPDREKRDTVPQTRGISLFTYLFFNRDMQLFEMLVFIIRII